MATTPGEASTPAGVTPPKEEKTQPFRLRDLAHKMAQRRRRTTAAELTFKRGKGAAEVRVPLERTETVIGRDPVCDIVLSEKAASARHARIRRGPGGFYELEDLGSSNGVFVDGERVEKMTLLDGDSFQIGDTRFSILVAPVVGEEG
jgi:pSer/pThr/pTyr-binding forkhead associated (FHA) protein